MTYLILRCQYNRDTLSQVEGLRKLSDHLGVEPEQIQCPTMRVTRRAGRNRDRIEVDVPVLNGFLFVKWTHGNIHFVNYIEDMMPFLTAMRLPQGGYAYCADEEVAEINKLPAIVLAEPIVSWAKGDVAELTVGWLRGMRGTVERVRDDGVVKLRIEPKDGEKRGLKVSTLQIHGSALKVAASSQIASAGG